MLDNLVLDNASLLSFTLLNFTVLNFTLQQPITVVQAAPADNNREKLSSQQ